MKGFDPTTLSVSQADVLSIFEESKANGMTPEQNVGIAQLAQDAQVSKRSKEYC